MRPFIWISLKKIFLFPCTNFRYEMKGILPKTIKTLATISIFELLKKPIDRNYDAIVLAVAHDEFMKLTLNQVKAFGKDVHVIYDIKYLFEAYQVDGRL